jgi:DHA1 family tetracycline resistance protein-like MFS transporter
MKIAFLVAFLDIVGFTIIIPVFVYYAQSMGASAQLATAMLGIYPLAMLIATPILGRLSDKHGRKPIIILCLVGAVGGYLMLGFASSLIVIALSRLIQGCMAGNISVIQAYVADITDEKHRAQGMGIIGAAIGLGFVLGPAIGSYLGGETFAEANLQLPAFVSAALNVLALIIVIVALPESNTKEIRSKQTQDRPSFFASLRLFMSRPILFGIIMCNLVFNLAAGLVETIFPIWIKDQGLIDGPRGLMMIFLCAGLLMAVVQGGVVGRLVIKFGEHGVIKAGAIIYALSLCGLMVSGLQGFYIGAVIAMACQAMAMAFVTTPLQALASQNASESERGAVMGLFSSVSTMGRVIGPATTGLIYTYIHFNGSFFVAILLALLLLVMVVSTKNKTTLLSH